MRGSIKKLVAVATAVMTVAGVSLVLGLGASPAGAVTASKYVVTAPSAVTAGVPFSLTVTVETSSNAVDTGYTGTVHFTSSDGSATLPANYTFTTGTGGDNGSHTFTATLETAGPQSITATDTVTGSITGTADIDVAANTATHFVVSAPAAASSGIPFAFSVEAETSLDTVATSYTGTVHFTSTDPLAGLPANYTFTGPDAGVADFTATLETAGPQTITATDTVTPGITGTSNVIEVGANHFVITAPSEVAPGAEFAFTVTAETSTDAVATNYEGTVHFTSSDHDATLPSNYTFTVANQGVATFDATLRTAGPQTITATDTVSGITGTSNDIVVEELTQLYGADAIGTAIAISQAEYPSSESVSAVVLARSDFFSDALAGGPLAARLGAPLLVTPGAPLSATIDPRVLSEIERVLAPGGTVYILGGDLALSPNIDTTLEGAGFSVVRLAGANEYGTAVAIAQAEGNPSTVFETTGLSPQDALSAGPAAIAEDAAILLTDGSSQSIETGLYILGHPYDTRYAIGGPLAAYGADPEAIPVYGSDLFGTSAAVATTFFPDATVYGAASADDFTDALAGGVFMATQGRYGPVLLVNPTAPLPPAIAAYLETLRPGTPGYVFGGPLAVGPDVIAALEAATG